MRCKSCFVFQLDMSECRCVTCMYVQVSSVLHMYFICTGFICTSSVLHMYRFHLYFICTSYVLHMYRFHRLSSPEPRQVAEVAILATASCNAGQNSSKLAAWLGSGAESGAQLALLIGDLAYALGYAADCELPLRIECAHMIITKQLLCVITPAGPAAPCCLGSCF
jgi:hypothetical protein